MSGEGSTGRTSPSITAPAYYERRGVSVWDIVEWWKCTYNIGCAVAYLLRHSHKNGAEDLQKAMRHIEREVTQLTRAASVESE